MPRRIAIVVPCFNEAARLDAAAFLRYAQDARETSILFVDDGSDDDTLACLQALSAEAPEALQVLHLRRNVGKAEAVRAGMLHLLAARPEYIGFWDADLATPLESVPEFSAVLDDHTDVSMVFGSRVRLLGRQVERRAARHYLGRIFATAASLALRLPVYDTQCGAKLFRVNAALDVILSEPFSSRWVFDVEIVARAGSLVRDYDPHVIGNAIYELPLRRWREVAGSKVKPLDFVRAIADLWRIHRMYVRPRAVRAANSGVRIPAPAHVSMVDASFADVSSRRLPGFVRPLPDYLVARPEAALPAPDLRARDHVTGEYRA